MHLKNFSLMHTNQGILFTPAYDLLNVNLIFPSDKDDLTLTLSGRKRKIKRADFDELGMSEIVINNIYKEFLKQRSKIPNLVNNSFLNDKDKERYLAIVNSKYNQIDL